MADDTGAADPSMEEILASIRKIISDDAPPAVEAAPEPSPAPEPVIEPVSTPAEPEPVEEILELTQMVQSDGSVVDLTAPEPVPPPLQPPPPAPSVPPPFIPSQAAPVIPAEPLVSEPAANSAASALSSLATTLEIERLAHAPSANTYLGNGGRTLEDMVIELMRPLLKEWLEQNLPPIVERLVQKEIERIAKRS